MYSADASHEVGVVGTWRDQRKLELDQLDDAAMASHDGGTGRAAFAGNRR